MKKKKLLFISTCVCAVLLAIFINENVLSDGVALPDVFNERGSQKSYSVIKKDSNKKYKGKGQEKVKGEGYFTTFTTEKGKVYKEYKMNGSAPWKDNEYWNNTMENSGCGITSMAVILSAYDKKDTPEDLRKKYFPNMNYENLPKELKKSYGIKTSGFYYDKKHLSKGYIKRHLKKDKPILICTWNVPEENRWTSTSHYMVLLATDGDEMVYVSNTNGGENDSKSSGWYNFDEVVPYIAKAIYIES